MNRIVNFHCLLIGAVAISFCACQSTPKPPKKGQGGGVRMDYATALLLAKKEGFRVPRGAGEEFIHYNAIALMTKPTLDPKSAPLGGEEVMVAASKFMNQKLGFVKRFRIISRLNTTTSALARELQADGKIDLDEKKRVKVHWAINGNVVLAKAEEQFKNQQNFITYVAKFIVEVKDPITDVPIDYIRSGTFTGSTTRQVYKTVEGKFAGGWSQTKESAAINEAVIEAMSRWMTFLGNELPVNGKIIGINEFDSNRMTLDKGVETGLSNKSTVCIWYKSGADKMPIAYAKCETGSDGTTSLQIAPNGWNTRAGNKKFAALIEEIRGDGNAWFTANQDKLYGTSWGVPLPDEWGGE